MYVVVHIWGMIKQNSLSSSFYLCPFQYSYHKKRLKVIRTISHNSIKNANEDQFMLIHTIHEAGIFLSFYLFETLLFDYQVSYNKLLVFRQFFER